MDLGIKNKVALVTGAAKDGLGRADAIALAQNGAKIAIIDIVDGSETVDIIKQNGGEAVSYICDISNMEAIHNTVNQIHNDLGLVSILINNASILTTVGLFNEISKDKFDRDIDVNITGTVNITRAVWPDMVKQKWGRVIMMSSIAGTYGGLGQTSYSTTKAAVIGLAKSLALEGARFNITANVIAPGVIESKTAVHMIRDDMLERMKKATAMKRFGKPCEIGNTIAFLCSEPAAYVTGQVLHVDGGMGLFVF